MWEYEPHTAIKHKILRGYLDRWMPIITATSPSEVLYFDAFAGPGRYAGGEPGSPIIAIEAAEKHRRLKQKIRMTFIDETPEHASSLERTLEPYRQKPLKNVSLHQKVLCEPCDEALFRIVAQVEERHGQTPPPALFFLDQFGYSQVPMSLVKRLLAHPRWETFGLIEWGRLNQTITDPNKAEALKRAFGDDRWREAVDLQGKEREKFVVKAYRDALEGAGAEYTWHFAMRDRRNRLVYWLFFASKGLKGLEEMKEAMRTVDSTRGDYAFSAFSDRGGEQGRLFEYDDSRHLADDLMKRFGGQTVDVSDVHRYTLTSTPGVNSTSALRLLEKERRIKVPSPPPGRRKGSFKTYRDRGVPLAIEFTGAPAVEPTFWDEVDGD